MHKTTRALALAALAGAAHAGELASATAASTPASANVTVNTGAVDNAQDANAKATLAKAASLITARQSQAALDLLDPLVAELEARYKGSTNRLYCSHGMTETLFYMLSATTSNEAATALDYPYCDAYFMRGFAEIDLGRHARAETDYGRALALAPANPHYLSEMAELHSMRHDWSGALKYFNQAREYAPVYSAPGDANAELGRALRGIGYVDVELGKLNEAEAAYRRCLEIDAKDKKATAELGYVLNLKARQLGLGK